MRPTRQTLTGNGATQNSTPILMDTHRNPFNVSLGVNTDGSATTVTVQYTLDDPLAAYATDFGTDATWFTHSDISAVTADTDANFAFPVTGIRVQLGGTGTDIWVLTVLQAGTRAA